MDSSDAGSVSVEEFVYLTVDGLDLRMRLFRPPGDGPFPAVVECHGGGWCVGDRTNNDPINRALAQEGVVVAAIDFRMPPEAPYPAALTDVHFAIRWLKANADRCATRADMVGVMGSSSGGHLTLLAAMRSDDARYGGIWRPGVSADADASVPFAVTLWPVICPLGRYQYLKNIPKSDAHPVLMEGVARHDAFWGDEAAMREGSPVYALEDGEPMRLPHVLYIQNEIDNLHPRRDIDRFLDAYRKAGGNVVAEMFRGETYDFLRADPDSSEAQRARALISAFIKDQAGASRS